MTEQSRKLTALLLLFATVSNLRTASAQDTPFRFELTPFTAYRLGGGFEDNEVDGEFDLDDSQAYGFMLNGYVNPNGQWELIYARQDTEIETQSLFGNAPGLDMNVEYLQFGGTYLFNDGNTRPFIALTLGASRFDPQPSAFSSESFFSASFGAGYQLNAGSRLGARLEGRVFTTLIDSDSDIFCESSAIAGSCLIRVDGTTLTQWELRAGLVFRF